jgi:hypothetical protein
LRRLEDDAWESHDHDRYRRMRHSDAIEQVFSPHRLLGLATERGNGDQAAGAHILPCSPAAALRWLP